MALKLPRGPLRPTDGRVGFRVVKFTSALDTRYFRLYCHSVDTYWAYPPVELTRTWQE